MARLGGHRVAVTGIGLITPFAAGREASWQAIRSGQSACRWVDVPLPHEPFGVATPPKSMRVAGAPAPPSILDGGESPEPIVSLALRAASEAWADARLDGCSPDEARLGAVIGTSKGGLRSFVRAFRPIAGEFNGAESWPLFLPDAPALAIARRFQACGPVHCPVAACATGLASLQRGAELIRDGTCDVVLAGSTDASLTPIVLASFQRLGVLARGFDDPAAACRPFHRRRSGFVIGEGAAVLVLERWEAAVQRGARMAGEWLAGVSLGDAAGLTHLDPTGDGLCRLIGDVLDRAGLCPEDIDYVNLHGTGTRENDAVETRGIRRAFGRGADRLRTSSLKGALGHLLGAAGSVETACTLLAMRDGIIPPTLHLNDRDPACDLDYTPHAARPARIRHALKLSLGFGGHLSAAVFRAVE